MIENLILISLQRTSPKLTALFNTNSSRSSSISNRPIELILSLRGIIQIIVIDALVNRVCSQIEANSLLRLYPIDMRRWFTRRLTSCRRLLLLLFPMMVIIIIIIPTAHESTHRFTRQVVEEFMRLGVGLVHRGVVITVTTKWRTVKDSRWRRGGCCGSWHLENVSGTSDCRARLTRRGRVRVDAVLVVVRVVCGSRCVVNARREALELRAYVLHDV